MRGAGAAGTLALTKNTKRDLTMPLCTVILAMLVLQK